MPRDPRTTPSVSFSRRRLGTALLAGGSLALMARLACAAEPLLAEPAFRQQDHEWWDERRQRAVPVRVYAPSAAAAPVPLLVFSHGIGGSRAGYSYLGRFLAGQGVASLHLQHVGSDRQVWMGNPLGIVSRLQGAAQAGEAVERVHDLRFALDQALAGEGGLRVDARRIVAAGHSYGANTTLLASGALVEREGRSVSLRDERIRAAVLLSAPPFYGASSMDRILGGIALPSLHITTTDDVIRIPGYYSGPEDRLKVFEAVGSAQKWLAVFEGGSHSLFVGRQGEGHAVLRATRELVLAFVRQVFDGEAQPLADWPQRHGPLLAQFAARA